MKRMRILASRSWLIQLALACVLLTQSLGLIHRAVHGPAGGSPPSVVQQGHANAMGALFAAHEKDGDCRLFDQLAHADFAPPFTEPPVFDVIGEVQQPSAVYSHTPRNERSPSARGPPAWA